MVLRIYQYFDVEETVVWLQSTEVFKMEYETVKSVPK